jgi:hypothetical protein
MWWLLIDLFPVSVAYGVFLLVREARDRRDQRLVWRDAGVDRDELLALMKRNEGL